MARKLRSPFIVVIAGAIAACASEAPKPTNQGAVTLPANPPRALPPPDLAVTNEASKPSDRDGDGFLDLEDKCPDEPGDDKRPASFGCVSRIRIIGNPPSPVTVRFEGNSAVPSKSSTPELDEAAALMKGHPEIKLVRIEGHDDPSSPRNTAMAISKARAVAVMKELVKRGVEASRLRAVGFGGYCPLELGRTPDDRARNRRANFKVETTDQGATDAELGCAPARDAGIK